MIRCLLAAVLMTALVSVGEISPNPNVDIGTSHSLQITDAFVPRYEIRESGQFVHAFAFFDYDGDGDLDAFSSGGDGSANASPSQVYLNDGTGRYARDPSFFAGNAPGQVHPRKALKGDFNGDGKLDFFVVGHGYDQPPFPGEAPYVLLSSPGGFVLGTGLSSYVGFQHGGASADVDGDGDLDVFVADNAQPFLLLNDGSGTFTRNTSMISGLSGQNVFTAELVDVDQDGFVDLLVAGHEQDGFASQILWGASSGDYTTQRRTVLPAVANYGTVVDIDVADLDGDGKRDVVLNRTGSASPQNCFYCGYSVQIAKQGANRSFTDVSDALISDHTSNADGWFDWLRIQDVDGDGRLDLLADDASRNLAWFGNGTTFERTQPRPGEVQNIWATTDLYDRIDITWDAVDNAAGYDVYRSRTHDGPRTLLASNLDATSFSDTTAVGGTQFEDNYYNYFVAARRGIAVGDSWSSGYGRRLLAPPPSPDTVTASFATFTDKIRVSWNAVAAAESYRLFRNTTLDSATAILRTGPTTATEFDDETTVPGTTYYYWIKASNGAGSSSFSVDASGLRRVARPVRPTGLAATDDLYPDRIRVTWNAVDNATSYQVFRSEEDTLVSASLVVDGLPGVLYDDFSARPGVTTYYWVKAKNSGGVSVDFSGPVAGVRSLANDGDGDGIPDDWEAANGLDSGNPDDGKLDVDGDGFSARQEYARNSDPQRYVMTLEPGWNLIGIARQPEDNHVDSIFGDLISGRAWSWKNRRFRRADRLEPHKGYWLFSPTGGDVEILLDDQPADP